MTSLKSHSLLPFITEVMGAIEDIQEEARAETRAFLSEFAGWDPTRESAPQYQRQYQRR